MPPKADGVGSRANRACPRSIEKFGVCQPVLISKDRTIVHGHGVVEAARAAGLTQIPVVFVEHLSPTEQRLLLITLNRLGETGQWDEEGAED
jgi:ParB-like chromosome segregation protein Spo0J